MSTTAGGCAARSREALDSPITLISSSLTILTRTWPGVRLFSTSSPSAFSLTRSTKALTTGSATSASSRAMRTSRMVSRMLSSVSLPWPRSRSSTLPRRPERFSNMFGPVQSTE